MHKVIPCYGLMKGDLKVSGQKAHLEDNGQITWMFTGSEPGKIRVVACPRSGTMYTTQVLRHLGYCVGHENMGTDGSVGYHLSVVKPDNCLHQVRHPLRQIASMVAHKNWGFAQKIVSVPNMDLSGCMTLWLEMNEMCDEFAVWRFQIEELPEVWDEFCERIGHEKCDMPDIPTDTNKDVRTKSLTWVELHNCDKDLAQRIFRKAREYGYYPQGQMVPDVIQDNPAA